MLLGTFGAIISFALDLENQGAEFYERSFSLVFPKAGSLFLKGSNKRIDRLKLIRQELVTEMILVPITDVDGDEYTLTISESSGSQEGINQAIQVESNMLLFYEKTAPSIPMKEVQRAFLRLAKENESRIATLKGMRQAS